jgi:uncharacterized protein with von Willebrand factor type A (vWA) domain
MNGSRPGSLSVHLVAFCRFLRSKGFLIGSGEETEMFNVLNQWSFDGVENFRLILSQLLCKSRQQQWEFSQLFDEFWQEILTSFDSKIKTAPSGASKRKRPKPVSLPEFKDWLYNKQSSVEEEIAF